MVTQVIIMSMITSQFRIIFEKLKETPFNEIFNVSVNNYFNLL